MPFDQFATASRGMIWEERISLASKEEVVPTSRLLHDYEETDGRSQGELLILLKRLKRLNFALVILLSIVLFCSSVAILRFRDDAKAAQDYLSGTTVWCKSLQT